MEEILHEGRFAGLFLHPSSLPNGNGLTGDFGKSAYEFIDYLVAARLNYWQVLPLGPCKYNGEQPACPYMATSSFALNPLFVSVEALVAEGLVSDEEVKQLLADSECEEVNSKSDEHKDQKVLQSVEEHRCPANLCTSTAAEAEQGSSSAIDITIVESAVSPGSKPEEGNDDTPQPESVEDKHEPQAASSKIAVHVDEVPVFGRAEAVVNTVELAASSAKRGHVSQANFAKTAVFKEKVLTLCYERFKKDDPPREFVEFCKKNSFWLEGYACFEALQARFPTAPTWLQWPDQYKNYRACRKSKDTALLTVLAAPLKEEEIAKNTEKSVRQCRDDPLPAGDGKGDNDDVNDVRETRGEGGKKVVYQTTPEYHMFVQYKVFTHWRDLKNYANKHEVNIFGDVAFYVNLHSSDVWTSPEMFQMDSDTLEPLYVSGSPPDTFCEGGQLWGHPVYDWQTHEKTLFRWWTQRIKTTFEHVDALRLDHFRGFVAYWRVPYDHAVKHKNASKGEWVPGPGDKLFDVLYRNMGWQLPKKTIPAAMQQQHHLLGPIKTHHARHNGLKHKLRQMACFGMRLNNSTRFSAAHVSATVATAADSAAAGEDTAAVRQTSPEINSDIILYNESRVTYRGTAPMIVAEDLGLITEEIVILRDKYNILSMRVLQFAWAEQEKGPNSEHLPYNITRNCCVYTGTHDNDTLIGWWRTASQEQKQHLTNFIGREALKIYNRAR